MREERKGKERGRQGGREEERERKRERERERERILKHRRAVRPKCVHLGGDSGGKIRSRHHEERCLQLLCA